MPAEFQYDVFLSHSSKDKVVVRLIAGRLRKDGLRVWFDEWVLKPGDSIPAKIEEGLERSRVLLLCMSANAFGSDWAQLEAGTFRFRDPMNKDRRFIPVRLDDAPIRGSLAQFVYINWPQPEREQEYARLVDACRSQSKTSIMEVALKQPGTSGVIIRLSCKPPIDAYAFSADGKRVLTGGRDKTVRLWNLDTGACIHLIRSHRRPVQHLEWSKDESRALIWTDEENVRLLDVKKDLILADYGRTLLTKRQMDCFRLLAGGLSSSDIQHLLHLYALTVEEHLLELKKRLKACTRNDLRALVARFYSVHRSPSFPPLNVDRDWLPYLAWAVELQRALSGNGEHYPHLRLCTKIGDSRWGPLNGSRRNAWALAWTADQRYVASGLEDGVVELWDAVAGVRERIFEGHTARVGSVAWHPDQRHLLSGSMDQTAKLWDTKTGRLLAEWGNFWGGVRRIAWNTDGFHAYLGNSNGFVQLLDLSEFFAKTREQIPIVTVPSPEPDQVQYTNAKVLLVGESGVGKTGLSNYLARNIKVEDDKPLASTDGVWATHWPLRERKKKAGVEREIWLWDFAGQVDYRLVHQLFMDDAAAAVLVFNPQNENPFDGLGHWDRDLQKSSRKPFAKLLTAGRIDRGGLVVSAASMTKFMAERGFTGPLHLTSAKTEDGCERLREAIVQAIDWKKIPETTSPALYHRLKQEILSLRDSGLVLIRLAELKQRMEMTLGGENFELAELETVVSLLSGPGMIKRLDFGGFILLRPEVLSRYAAAVVRKVRKHPQELGCIREDELLAGDLDYQDFKRLAREDEAVVLRALLETFICRAWCLRQACDGTAMLTFPSYFRRERKDQPSHPSVLVTYRFDGPVDDIYATLVVRLHHTVAFEAAELWKSAADFKTQTGKKLGFTLLPDGEGTSRLEIYFEPDVDGNSRVVFLRYIHDHLMQQAQNVVRLRRYYCPNQSCDSARVPFPDQTRIDKAVATGGKGKVFCPDCGKPILLRDVIEKKFESPAVKEKVREMQVEGQEFIDNESREMLAVHHTGFIVAEAGQIYRGYTNSDHGIDGEIEFKDDQGRASGKRLYVQLKSGDSYLTKRRTDDKEVFQIKNPRWADYWQHHAYAVMLVIRMSDGEIRWMDVSACLKRESAGGKAVKQIVFDGERFDVMSVRRWREKELAQEPFAKGLSEIPA